jgi:uncharacterized membrane protein YbhN (UPF0104 family)
VSRQIWAWARVLGGIAVLAFLVRQVGTGPFLDGVRMVDGWSLAAALGIGALTTVCCAWRWALVARSLGVGLSLPVAVAAYYRSLFLNTTLPGGVVGDVHRAVRHGKDIGDVPMGVRAVVVERVAGLVVTIVLAVVVLAVFPSPVRSRMPAAVAVLVVGGLVVFGALTVARGGTSWWRRAIGTAGSYVRKGLATRRTWVGVVLATAAVLAGHLATFLLAARTAGATAPLSLLAPLTLLALLAMALPVNVAGWGPREGVAAWAFGAAGLTAAQGVATAVVYGVLVLVATLPGAAVLVTRRIGRQRHVLRYTHG